MPPPQSEVHPDTVLFVSVSVPEFNMPPPPLHRVPLARHPFAEFPDTVLSITVSLPRWFEMPPPKGAEFPDTVVSTIVSVPEFHMPPPS
jgi:hypothetical protein